MRISKNLILLFVVLILLVVQVGLIFSFYAQKEQKEIVNIVDSQITLDDHQVLQSYFMNPEFYNEAYANSQPGVVETNSHVYGGIIPHHLIVKDYLASYFNGFKDQYQTVVLIGPNHFDSGSSNILLSQAVWQTPYGKIYPDDQVIKKLAKDFSINEDAFFAEHSITGLVPFIKKSLPSAKIVPIILKVNTSNSELEELLTSLSNTIDPAKTLVLASIDFSHYQRALAADFHDAKSINTIKTFNYDAIPRLEIDSPPSLFVLLKYLDSIDARTSQLVYSTNSSILMGEPDEPGTSHQFFYFNKGEAEENKLLSFLFFGDIMLDRHVKTLLDQKGLPYLLDTIAGEENRFFRGMDLVSANLEGAITKNGDHYPPVATNDFAFSLERVKDLLDYNFNFFTIANNHLSDQGFQGIEETRANLDKLDIDYVGCVDAQVSDCSTTVVEIDGYQIGVVGLSMVYHDFEIADIAQQVIKLKEETDFIIANIHWGVEYTHYFNDHQQDIAHQLIDSGVDIIIGHHPHVVQGREIYNNKPIFYSLGNFIFDQYFSKETQEGMGVGITVDGSGYDLYLFPYQSANKYLELLAGKEKDAFYTNFGEWSEGVIDIQDGKIRIR
ncbi:MAG: AmmeMemoRadiSam system protein B [Candidatus Komeilibacteria bacterium]